MSFLFRPHSSPSHGEVMRRAESVGRVLGEVSVHMDEPDDRIIGRVMEVEAEFRNIRGGK